MDYELAKKLKDAGFPQTDTFLSVEDKDNGKERLHYPTLSELIEACGEDFIRLVKSRKEYELLWSAVGGIEEFPSIHNLSSGTSQGEIYKFMERGKFPEEAVANLWLKLNKSA